MTDVDDTPAPRTRRGLTRRTSVLAGLVSAAALIGSTRMVWADASGADLAGAEQAVDVLGVDAAPAAAAVAMVAIAAAVATSLSSRWIRLVTGPVLIASGLIAASSMIGVVLDPAAASSAAVSEATGVVGAQSEASSTLWPLLSLLPALAVCAVGVVVLAVGGRWPTGARYRRATVTTAADPAQDPAAAWDALTRGEDPSLERESEPDRE